MRAHRTRPFSGPSVPEPEALKPVVEQVRGRHLVQLRILYPRTGAAHGNDRLHIFIQQALSQNSLAGHSCGAEKQDFHTRACRGGVVGARGIEPPTLGSEDRCSIR
jgi:hypothetical protein